MHFRCFRLYLNMEYKSKQVLFRRDFWYAASVMDEAALRTLLGQVNSGKLSRNKNFAAYQDPSVQNARARHHRIQAIKVLVTESSPDELTLEPDPSQPGRWHLMFRFARWDFSWSAWLYEVELDLLADHPELSGLIQSRRVS